MHLSTPSFPSVVCTNLDVPVVPALVVVAPNPVNPDAAVVPAADVAAATAAVLAGVVVWLPRRPPNKEPPPVELAGVAVVVPVIKQG